MAFQAQNPQINFDPSSEQKLQGTSDNIGNTSAIVPTNQSPNLNPEAGGEPEDYNR